MEKIIDAPFLPSLAGSHSEGGWCGVLVRAGAFRGWLVVKVKVSDKQGQTDLFLVGPGNLNFPGSAEETHLEETGSF